ncbi:MAG TPA: hypothetical protein VGM41_22195 [Chitinophagaceae bacterium]
MSEQLKHKMQQWEVQPPPRCWDAIASRLDDVIPLPSAKLYHLEIPPPPVTWNAITGALDTPVPVKRLSSRPWRLAAAAIVLLLLAGSTRWIGGRYFKKEVAATKHPASQQAPVLHATNNLPVINDVQDDNDEDETADGHTGFSSTAHKPSPAGNRSMRSAPVSIQPPHTEYPVTLNYASMPEDDRTMTNHLDPSLTDNNYLVLTYPNGEVTKASVKMADALRYLYGENTTDETGDKTINENSNWKKRLQEWRSKIMSSHFIPASANFLDIVDLKDLVEEKP